MPPCRIPGMFLEAKACRTCLAGYRPPLSLSLSVVVAVSVYTALSPSTSPSRSLSLPCAADVGLLLCLVLYSCLTAALKVLVKVNPEGKYVVDIDKDIDVNKCTPNTRVALRNDSYVLHKILPTKVRNTNSYIIFRCYRTSCGIYGPLTE